MDEKLTDEEEAIIPEEDFREAIAACSLDPLLERYFRLAPPGAKLFIGLGFYSTHFGDKVNPAQYAECQAEIEPALTINDLKYLIRFEDDKNTKKYLRGLLLQREAEAAAQELHVEPTQGEPSMSQPAQVGADYIPPVPRRRRRRGSERALQWMLRKDSVRWLPLIGKAAAVLAVLLGGAVFVYMNRDRLAGTPSGAVATNEVVAVAAEKIEAHNAMASNSVAEADAALPPVATNEAVAAAAPTADEVEKMAQIPDDAAPRETNIVAVAAESDVTNAVDKNAAVAEGVSDTEVVRRKRKARRPKVVFTDGRKVVRHQDGRVEVPRVFSCAGAGVKAFWVYGPNHEKEAAKERKARLEWKMLCKQAEAGGMECQSE